MFATSFFKLLAVSALLVCAVAQENTTAPTPAPTNTTSAPTPAATTAAPTAAPKVPVIYSACSSIASCNDTQAIRTNGKTNPDFNITWDGILVPYAQLNCGSPDFTICRRATKAGEVYTVEMHFMGDDGACVPTVAATLTVDLSQPRGTTAPAACGVIPFDSSPVSAVLGVECDAAGTCGGHGACDDGGRCLCDVGSGYYGDDGCYLGSAEVDVVLSAAPETEAYRAALGSALGVEGSAVWVAAANATGNAVTVPTIFLARSGVDTAAVLATLRAQAIATVDNAALLAMGVTSVQFAGEAPISVVAYKKDDSSSGLGGGAIAGIIIAVLAVAGLVGGGFVLHRRRAPSAALTDPLTTAA